MKLVRIVGPDVLRVDLVRAVMDSLYNQKSPPGYAQGVITATRSNNKETIVARGYHEHTGTSIHVEPSYEELERYFLDRDLCARSTACTETIFADLTPRENAIFSLRNFVTYYNNLVTAAPDRPNLIQFPALTAQDRALLRSSLVVLLSWLAFNDVIPDVQLQYPSSIIQDNVEGCVLRVYPNIPNPQAWLEEDAKLRAFLAAYKIQFSERNGAIQGNDFQVRAVVHLADAVLFQCGVRPMFFAFSAQDSASLADVRARTDEPPPAGGRAYSAKL